MVETIGEDYYDYFIGIPPLFGYFPCYFFVIMLPRSFL